MAYNLLLYEMSCRKRTMLWRPSCLPTKITSSCRNFSIKTRSFVLTVTKQRRFDVYILQSVIAAWRLVHCSQWLAYMLLITNGQSNLTQGHIAAAHGWFSRIRQVATIGTPSNAPPIGICTLLVLSPVSHFEHIDPQTCPVMAWVDPLKLSLCIWGSGPYLVHCSLGPCESTSRMASQLV